MTFGVVIPFYKLSFFEETLSSLAAQTNKNFKVYIGDDASPEDPSAVIKNYSGTLDLEYKRFEQNLGQTSLTRHWDRCIAMSRDEEYIMVLGDDDILSKNVISCFHRDQKKFNKKKQLVRFASKMIDENSAEISPVFYHQKEEYAADSYFRKFKGYTRSSLSEYAFPREVYQEKGFYPYPLGWHSDDRAWLDFSGSQPIYTINDALVLIRNSNQNISSRTENLSEKFNATRQFYRYLLSSRLKEYSTDKKYGLINAYEELLKKEKAFGLRDWSFLFCLHLIHYRSRDFKRFLKKTFLKG